MDSKTPSAAEQINYHYEQIKERFHVEREREHKRQKHRLTRKLEALIRGDEKTFLEEVEDLQESRDLELVRLKVWQTYMIDRARSGHEERMSSIEDMYQTSSRDVQDRFAKRLEAQADALNVGAANYEISGGSIATGNGRDGRGSAPPRRGRPGKAEVHSRRARRTRESGNMSDVLNGTEDLRGLLLSDFDSSDYGSTAASAPPTTTTTTTTTASGRGQSKQPKLLPLRTEEIDQDVDLLRRAREGR
jgi:hypothetical protein